MDYEIAANKPAVWLVGDVDHGDFVDAMALVRSTAHVEHAQPEVIIVAQCRPWSFGNWDVDRLRRSAPLAGVVSLLGSWCEGETRTGRPLTGTQRLYWYEFPSWWRRQLLRRSMGFCPAWASAVEHRRRASCTIHGSRVAVITSSFDSAEAIRDVVQAAGGESSWWRSGAAGNASGEVDVGLWLGGQLNDAEANQLADCCARLAKQGAPVVALLDFPRRDRCAIARQAGAAAVLAMPWCNADLVAELSRAIQEANQSRPPRCIRAA
jgi:hypothetical protein